MSAEQVQYNIDILDQEIFEREQKRRVLLDELQVLNKSNIHSTSEIASLDRPPTVMFPNTNSGKILTIDKFRELKTPEDLFEIFKRVFPEGYQRKLRALPTQLRNYENPKYNFMKFPVYLNHVGVPLLGGPLRRNDPRLYDEENPFWGKVWKGFCKILKQMIPNQRFEINEISRYENTKIGVGIFTLTVQLSVDLQPEDKIKVANWLELLKNGDKTENKVVTLLDEGDEMANGKLNWAEMEDD